MVFLHSSKVSPLSLYGSNILWKRIFSFSDKVSPAVALRLEFFSDQILKIFELKKSRFIFNNATFRKKHF